MSNNESDLRKSLHAKLVALIDAVKSGDEAATATAEALADAEKHAEYAASVFEREELF